MTVCAYAISYFHVFCIFAAANKGKTHDVVRLIEAGADPNIASEEGITPCIAASENGHEEVSCQFQVKFSVAYFSRFCLVLKSASDSC